MNKHSINFSKYLKPLPVLVILTLLSLGIFTDTARVQNALLCNGLVPTIVGTEGDDVIKGTNGDDVILGLGGNDIIKGRNGHDVICGGDGADQLEGGNAIDFIDGGPGNDTIKGNNGSDTLNGKSGIDSLNGGNGTDTCISGETNTKCETITHGNNPPSSNAGPDQSVFVNEAVILDGSGSSDPDGDPITYLWSFVSVPIGSTATLSDPTVVNPDFTVDVFGTYVLELIVNDDELDSAQDSVTITTLNSPPVANAGPDQAINVPSTVQLDGSGSTDVEGDQLTYNWSFTDVPPGSTATLSDPTIVNPTFDADLPGTYMAQLIVNDGTVDSPLDIVVITTAGIIPEADAGLDQSVFINDTAQLDGSGSSDADNDPLTYSWSFVSVPIGSTATLSDPNIVNPTFVVDVSGDYVIQLIVNDGTIDSTPDTVMISTINIRPVSDAGLDQTVAPGSTVQLDGSASFDADNDPITYNWSLISLPSDSSSVLSDSTIVNPTFQVDQTGTYIAQLIVNDGLLNSDPDNVAITRNNNTPVLDPVGNQTIALGSTLTLVLTGSDTDNDSLSFSASPLPLPSGSNLDSNTGVFTFTPNSNQTGDIPIIFIVSDGELTGTESIIITVTGVPPSGGTTLLGRVLDANDAANSITTPIIGATITIDGTGIITTSDTNGDFILNNLPGGDQVFKIDSITANNAPDGSPYASFAEAITLIVDVVNNVDRPFYLPRIDEISMTTVDPSTTTIVDNPNLGVSLEVPPNTAKNPDGTDFTGDLSISLVPGGFAPAELPEELEPGLLVTIQPVGVTFSEPAPITFPNTDNLAPGSQVDIWSLDPDTGQFIVVGTGQVSVDGSVIETISGGIIAADWHAPLPPAPAGGPPTNDPNPGGPDCPCWDKDTGSRTALATGNLSETHNLAPYFSLNKMNRLTFVYNSSLADSRPIISRDSAILQIGAVPNTASISLSLSGIQQGTELFTDTSTLSESQDEDFTQSIQLDATNLQTGVYPYSLKITSNFNVSKVSDFLTGEISINNQIDSPFGSGWTLSGLSQLHPQQDGSVLITEGFGETLHFQTFEQTMTPPVDPGATEGTALLFDGINDWATGNPAGPLLNTIPLTLEAWVKPELNNIETTVFPNVMNNHNSFNFGQAAHGFGVNIWDTGNILIVEFHNGVRTVPNTSLIPEQWYHIAVVYTTGNLKVYLDGTLVDDFSYTQETQDGGFFKYGLFDGNNPDLFDWYKGSIDEVRIWQSARTQQEIIDNMSTQLNGDEPGLVLYTKMDSGQGQLIIDETINQNHGSLGSSQNPNIDDPAWVTYPISGQPQGGDFTSPLGDYSALFSNPDGTYTRVMKDRTEINYDAQGLQTSIVDRNGNTTTYAYDANGLLTSITDPVGMVTTLTYVAGKLSTVTDPAGRVTSFQHDGSGNLTQITDPDLTTRMFSYDSSHKLISQKSKRGFSSTYQYNFAGRNTSAVRPDGSSVLIQPSSIFTLPDVSIGLGSESNPSPVFRPNDAFTSFVDDDSNTTTYKTNKFGSIVERTDALGKTKTFVRDENNNLIQFINERGNVSDFTYDNNGNLLSKTNQSIGSSTIYTYTTDGFNLIKTITDPNNNITTFSYNANGNLTSIKNALNNETTFTYDNNGLLSTRTDALNNAVTINYDQISANLISFTNQLNLTTNYSRDSIGNILMITDAENRTTQFAYDVMNRVTSRIFPDLTSLNVTYDQKGNMITYTDAKNNINTFTYDQRERMTSRTDPLGKTEIFSYDGNGNIVKKTDRKNQTTIFDYDQLNRIIMKSLPGNNDTNFVYDQSGNITSITDPDSVLIFNYDGGSRLTSASTTGSPNQPDVTLTHTYDSSGNRSTMTDPTGTTNYSYDVLNRLTSIINSSSQTFTFNYDDVNRLTQKTFPNNVINTFGYDTKSQLTSIVNDISENNFSTFTYSYDDIGRRIQLSTTRTDITVNNILTYGYDLQSRLTSSTNPLPSLPDETFIYDNNGNRIRRDGQTFDSIYDNTNRLIENEEYLYEYDDNGNLDLKTEKNTNEITDFTYDPENRLIIFSKPGVTASYKYDGLGRRIEKNVNGNIKRYVYDGFDLLLEYDGNNVLEANYTHGLGIDSLLFAERQGAQLNYHTDGLNNTTEITDATGAVVKSYAYDSFGNIVSENGTIENSFTYTGREFDSESGLYYYRTRYYDPSTGRYIQEDPIGLLGGINLYSYVSNNPVNFIDPFGLFDTKRFVDAIGKGALIGGALGGSRSGLGGAIFGGFAGGAIAGSRDAIDQLSDDDGDGILNGDDPYDNVPTNCPSCDFNQPDGDNDGFPDGLDPNPTEPDPFPPLPDFPGCAFGSNCPPFDPDIAPGPLGPLPEPDNGCE